MKKIFNSNFDIHGSETLRVAKMYVFSRIVPIGNLQRGPGIRCLVVLIILHSIGKPIFDLLMKYENKVHKLYQLLKRVKGRV